MSNITSFFQILFSNRGLLNSFMEIFRSSHPEVFLEKDVLKKCNKFTGEHPCRSVTSIKLLCNFIEFTLRHGSSPVNLLHIFRRTFIKNTSGRLVLDIIYTMYTKRLVTSVQDTFFCIIFYKNSSFVI